MAKKSVDNVKYGNYNRIENENSKNTLTHRHTHTHVLYKNVIYIICACPVPPPPYSAVPPGAPPTPPHPINRLLVTPMHPLL